MRKFTRNFGKAVKNMALVLLGTLVLAFGTAAFILPAELVCGGISGISLVIVHLLNARAVTVDLVVFVLTWVLFFTGLFVLGGAFAIKTLLSALVYPTAVSLFLRLGDALAAQGIFDASARLRAELALLICAFVGGLLVGIGCALTFIGGGSTGGVDIIAFSICKVIPRLRPSVVIFLIDAATIVFGMIVMKDLLISLIGVFSALISAVAVDKMLALAGSRSK